MPDPFDYIESRADADELISDFGQSAVVRRVTNSGPPYAPTQTTTDYATQAVRVEFTLKQLQRGNVLETDERWLVAAGPLATSGITVQPGDAIVAGGVSRTVVNADPLNPAGVAVMFDCHVRV